MERDLTDPDQTDEPLAAARGVGAAGLLGIAIWLGVAALLLPAFRAALILVGLAAALAATSL